MFRRTAVMLAAAAVLLTSAATPLLAATPAGTCDQQVADTTEELTHDDVRQLDAAADQLADQHDVVVRVRLLADADGPIDNWFERQLDTCNSWQADNGLRHPRLLVVAVALQQRETGTYYGPALSQHLDGYWPQVHDQMGQQFQNGRFAEGLLVGLETYNARLAQDIPTSTTDEGDNVEAATPDRTTGNALSPMVFLVVMALIVAGALLVGAITAWRTLQTRRRERQQARQAATEAASAARTRLYDLDSRFDTARTAADASRRTVADDDTVAVDLDRELDEAEAAVNQAAAALADHDHTDLEDIDDPEQLQTITDRYRTDVLEAIETATIEVEDVEQHTEQLQQLTETLDTNLTEAAAHISQADQQVADLAADGLFTDDLEGDLEQARTLQAQAKQARQEGRTAEASEVAQAAATTAAATRDRAAALPQLIDELNQQLQQLTELDSQLGDDLARAETQLDDLRNTWARSVWQDLTHLPDEVRASQDHISDAVDRITVALQPDQQRWADAERLLAAALAEHQTATTALTPVAAVATQADKAHDRLPDVLQDAADRIDDVQAFLDHHPDVADGHTRIVDRAARLLTEAHQLADAEPCDPLRAARRGRSAHEAADRALQRAEDAQQQLKTARRRAKAAIDDAEAAVSRAQALGTATSWIAGDLDDARRQIDDDPQAAARIADDVARRANRARRDKERERRRQTSATTSSLGGSSSFGSSLGGGSSSFGGGGGSSSFGGGGSSSFGGGGSSGW